MKHLRFLDLQGSEGITDAGLTGFRVPNALERVDLRGTMVTRDGINRFKRTAAHVAVISGRLDWVRRARITSCLTKKSTQIHGDEELREHPLMDRVSGLHLAEGVTEKGLEELGRYGNLELLIVTQAMDRAATRKIARLTTLKHLVLRDAEIADEQVEELSKSKSLEELTLDGTSVTDRGCRHLGKMKQLTWLSLENTKVTDEGLKALLQLSNLTRLDLAHTLVTEAGLADLSKMRHLAFLDVHPIPVSKEVSSKLEDLLPGLVLIP